ncbi:MAG: rhodanese-related sulfurtransferase [Marinicaulis sp.]|nr:rhodanese-related sulfurtransferase [Marinicaulis sp.]NNL88475.1 rhodanese-related sulfurtransferase [Marinicaulis sp.]
MTQYIVAAFYQFTSLPDFTDRQANLLAVAEKSAVFGTILLAHEGVNGTIAGPREGVDSVLDHIKTFPGCQNLTWKESISDDNPFHRIKVRLKKEIVTMGITDIDPAKSFERYVEPARWNEVISDPETLVIDTRNDYEVSIGTFEGALNPSTTSFREFPQWFRKFREKNEIKKVAMFCTGGIRCEKSTAFLRSQGIDNVVHLKGGILKYLEEVPKEKSLWSGECFVFDQRVSVNHDLQPGSYDLCHACRRPITGDDKQSEFYAPGISCANCYYEHDEKTRARFAERQKQIALAKVRGEKHLGAKQKPLESGEFSEEDRKPGSVNRPKWKFDGGPDFWRSEGK